MNSPLPTCFIISYIVQTDAKGKALVDGLIDNDEKIAPF